MSDSAILFAGVFSLALVLLGMVLTVYEFRKPSSRKSASVEGAGVGEKLAYKT